LDREVKAYSVNIQTVKRCRKANAANSVLTDIQKLNLTKVYCSEFDEDEEEGSAMETRCDQTNSASEHGTNLHKLAEVYQGDMGMMCTDLDSNTVFLLPNVVIYLCEGCWFVGGLQRRRFCKNG